MILVIAFVVTYPPTLEDFTEKMKLLSGRIVESIANSHAVLVLLVKASQEPLFVLYQKPVIGAYWSKLEPV